MICRLAKKAARLRGCEKYLRPHPEERALARVSKDGCESMRCVHPFETLAPQAPPAITAKPLRRDEVGILHRLLSGPFVLLRLAALAGILRLLAGFLIWVLTLLARFPIWILALLARLLIGILIWLAALVRIVGHRSISTWVGRQYISARRSGRVKGS
jgi:hypothetical protein